MLTGYIILFLFFASLVGFCEVEILFAERLQQTSYYINHPSLINRRLVQIGLYGRLLNMLSDNNFDYIWQMEDNWEQQIAFYKEQLVIRSMWLKDSYELLAAYPDFIETNVKNVLMARISSRDTFNISQFH